jgi:hypothetical protein
LPPMPPPAPVTPARSTPPSPALNPNGPQPVRIGPELVMEEFKSLALMHSQMAERLAAIEHEVTRLARDNQEIRELLARQNQP